MSLLNLLMFFLVGYGLFGLPTSADAATPWQFGLQDPATPVAEGILHFHHNLMFLLVFIVLFVAWMLFRTLTHYDHHINSVPSGVVHGTNLEIIWTIFPALILMFIAVPSFSLLYCVDEIVDPAITVKIVGHQWYWTYEYSDYFVPGDYENTVVFDSYMLPVGDLNLGDLRLLEVDNRLVLPVNTHIRFIVTAADVLHCWTVPSFAVKMDACPGRLNQASVFIQRQGTYYGQCSEICGINHGFMPIAVEVHSLPVYLSWVVGRLEDQ